MTELAATCATTITAPSDANVAHRDEAIDGWRAVAVGCVIFAHAISFRFAGASGRTMHYLGRLADSLSELGVQIFFVISGFIITSLMLREEARTGRVSIAAFYARRTFRILPPLMALYAVILLLAWTGLLQVSPGSMASSATFTCNFGAIQCDWWIAHTWSLAVEEQFYLVWPVIFVLLPPALRVRLLVLALVTLSIGNVVRAPTYHGNFMSFACIAAGALVATNPRLRDWCGASARTLPWLIVGASVIVAPLVPIARPIMIVLPLLIAYMVFASRGIGWARAILASSPFQAIGLASYSIYLWQQLFLAPASLYAGQPFPLLLLPIAVLLSYRLAEKPFIRQGHRLSRRLKARQEERLATASRRALRVRPS